MEPARLDWTRNMQQEAADHPGVHLIVLQGHEPLQGDEQLRPQLNVMIEGLADSGRLHCHLDAQATRPR